MDYVKRNNETSIAENISVNSINQSSPDLLSIASEIADLVWIAEGKCKNYTSPVPSTITSTSMDEEPSALYLSLPIVKPVADTLVSPPPYAPIYKELSAEQRGDYWRFLSAPFEPKNDIGYVFLFYYGLERHLALGDLDKAFEVILKLRWIYDNKSFQYYTAIALTLTCIAKQRPELALKFLTSDSENENTIIPTEYFLILKYTFHMPLTSSEIIKNYQFFEFDNNRYIKSQPKLFKEKLLGLIQQYYQSDVIDLNENFPMDTCALPVKQVRMFANLSLENFKASAPVFTNEKLIQSISTLLHEAHEMTKIALRELRKQGYSVPETKTVPTRKVSPIITENIPKKLHFDLSAVKGWEVWSSKQLLDAYFSLSTRIEDNKKVCVKLEACEQSYILLPSVMDIFFKDPAGPPPSIYCRDYGPRLYRQLGNWEDSKRAINLCINAKAYKTPDDGYAELEYLERYKNVGKITIDFIQKNPGFLQKDIYTALSQQIKTDDVQILKDFMRETYLFDKQPYKHTNKLYCVERKEY